jgi:choline dehydrogenase-like flavoprotein
MAQHERYDVLVLGSGTGGKLIAWHMARSGRRAAVGETVRECADSKDLTFACVKQPVGRDKLNRARRSGRRWGK